MGENRLTPDGYRPRLIEGRLDTLMRAFGCVEITGAKWCGKTWTALSRAQSVAKLDRKEEREAAELDPSLALMGETPHLVDEWQEVPEVWDAARRHVDDSGGRRGLIILTGSTALGKKKRERVRHSGAGRIARLTMRPMSLAESGDAHPAISLKKLLEDEPLVPARCETGISDVARWCCRGGWPANLGIEDDIACETAYQYLQAVLDENVVEEGRSPELAEKLLRALALNESQAVTYKTLRADMAYGEGAHETSNDTIVAYLDLFKRLYLTEDLCGWEPPMRAKARVRVKPKRYFVDPSIATAALGVGPRDLLLNPETFGFIFETLCMRDLRVYAEALDGSVSHFRDKNGLECDAVVHRRDGRYGLIETKLGSEKDIDDGVKALKTLSRKIDTDAMLPPSFLMVLTASGDFAFRRDDGILVVPIGCLKP